MASDRDCKFYFPTKAILWGLNGTALSRIVEIWLLWRPDIHRAKSQDRPLAMLAWTDVGTAAVEDVSVAGGIFFPPHSTLTGREFSTGAFQHTEKRWANEVVINVKTTKRENGERWEKKKKKGGAREMVQQNRALATKSDTHGTKNSKLSFILHMRMRSAPANRNTWR